MLRQNPERLAWLVMLVAFGSFCILCIGTLAFAQWFIFESTVPLTIELAVSRNTVGVSKEGQSEETERDARQIEGEIALTTDSTSQALLTFRDPYDGHVLATFTLFHDSLIQLRHTGRPRFAAGNAPYTIELLGQRGHSDIIISPNPSRDIRFRILTVYQTTIEMHEPGYYGVVLGGENIGITTRTGSATLRYDDRENPLSQEVPVGYQGIVPGTDQLIETMPANINLIYNSSFVLYEPTEDAGLSLLPAAWGCYHQQDELNEPRGEAVRGEFDGRAIMHIRRAGDGLNHAETGCRQLFTEMDLTPYSTLEVRSTFYIRSHSISTCGIKGSECPLMLRMVYLDENGETQEWIHGFYTKYTIPEWPLTCQSCRQDHERLNPGTWYTYESGNLVTTLPEAARMKHLIEVRFYASGHAYDVMVDEVSLVVSP